MRVGLSFDLKETMAHEAGAPDDMLEEYASPTTIGYIQRAIEGLGHATVKLGGGSEFIRNVLKEKVDIVFNIAGHPLCRLRPGVPGCLPGQTFNQETAENGRHPDAGMATDRQSAGIK